MSEKDEWKKINKGADCEITQPATPELCYPRNVYTNNRYTEKLLQYRKLKDNNKCNPTPEDPCILNKDGMVYPDAESILNVVPVEMVPHGNAEYTITCGEYYESDSAFLNNGNTLASSTVEADTFIIYLKSTATEAEVLAAVAEANALAEAQAVAQLDCYVSTTQTVTCPTGYIAGSKNTATIPKWTINTRLKDVTPPDNASSNWEATWEAAVNLNEKLTLARAWSQVACKYGNAEQKAYCVMPLAVNTLNLSAEDIEAWNLNSANLGDLYYKPFWKTENDTYQSISTDSVYQQFLGKVSTGVTDDYLYPYSYRIPVTGDDTFNGATIDVATLSAVKIGSDSTLDGDITATTLTNFRYVDFKTGELSTTPVYVANDYKVTDGTTTLYITSPLLQTEYENDSNNQPVESWSYTAIPVPAAIVAANTYTTIVTERDEQTGNITPQIVAAAVDELNATAYQTAASSVACIYNNPELHKNCPSGMAIQGNRCTISNEQYDACVQAGSITGYNNPYFNTESGTGIISSTLQNCFIQNVEIKAFCDRLAMYKTMVEDGITDPYIYTYKYSANNSDVLDNVDTHGAVIYIYRNGWETVTQKLPAYTDDTSAEAYDCYEAASHDTSVTISGYSSSTYRYRAADVTSYNTIYIIDDTNSFALICKTGADYDLDTQVPILFAKYSVDSSNKITATSINASHCLSTSNSIDSYTVSEGMFTNYTQNGNPLAILTDLNKNAWQLAISGMACFYGNKSANPITCTGIAASYNPYHVAVALQCTIGGTCDNTSTVNATCVVHVDSPAIQDDIYISESPWNSDQQAFVTQQASLVCLRCDKVGHGGGGGGGIPIYADVDCSCNDCSQSLCIFKD